MPLFLVASAAEAKAKAPAKDVAAWRTVVGNLLAGAVAGCAVEGGERAAGFSSSLPLLLPSSQTRCAGSVAPKANPPFQTPHPRLITLHHQITNKNPHRRQRSTPLTPSRRASRR